MVGASCEPTSANVQKQSLSELVKYLESGSYSQVPTEDSESNLGTF